MNTFSISLGRFFGIKTTIHWTFWILIVWIVVTNLREGQGSAAIIWYILFVFSIFACVVLHELGHALAARRYGIQTRSITILPIGGVASLEKIPEDPAQELVVAIAGPMVNVVIALILFFFLSVTDGFAISTEEMVNIGPENFLVALFSVNILLVLFNLIPAFPMDGGRVFRALLAMRMDRVQATQWAVNVGNFFAIIFVFYGFSNNPFLIFIALFIFLSARSELEHVRSTQLLSGHTVRDILMKDFTILDGEEVLETAVQALLNGQEKRFLVSVDQQIIGCLEKNALIQGLVVHGDAIPIQDIVQPGITWLPLDLSLEDARDQMAKSGCAIMPVGEPGQLEGVLDLDNLNEFLAVQAALHQRDTNNNPGIVPF